MGESFRDLIAWQRAIQMTVVVYKLTARFPACELYGLTSQLRRASVSTASNLAEGYGRLSRGEYRQFVGIARGSCCEVETELVIARALGYGSAQDLAEAERLCKETSRVLAGLLRSLQP